MSKSDLRIKSYGPREFKQLYFISVQSCLQFLPGSDPRPYINIVLIDKENPSPNTLILSSKALEKTPQNLEHRTRSFGPICRPNEFWPWEASPATTLVHAPAREKEHGEAIFPVKFLGQPPLNAPGSGFRILVFSDHSRPTYTFLPPFLDPLNSFPWSLFADSSPFERYDGNKVGRLLDRVFRPPQQPLDQFKGTSVFLVSWAFR